MPGQLPDPLIDRRPDARIVRSALDEVTAIQTLLADVYKDVGGGRTLQRELVQNADDARATRLVFVVLERGWPRAHNTLLRGPALLVANDGPFPAKDRDALHQAIGGAKAEDVEKIGRFGVGLKSVFHICEAIAYLGAENGVLRPGALNPWAGTGEGGDADPLHPEWDAVDDDDLRSLLEAATGLFESFEDGFLQWIPLRREAHLDRAPERPYGLGQLCPDTDEVASWFGRTDSLALLLAQCAHLSSIEADRALSPEELPKRAQLARVVRPDFGRREWVGRFEDDVPPLRRQFSGRIAATNKAWLVTGRERLGVDSLRELRVRPDWPRDPHWRGGRCIWLPRKALGHAAVTVVRPDKTPSPRGGARLRWAVFLPLDDAVNPGTNPVVETVGFRSDGDVWDIVMHGYFWPSHDRRSIPGVTDDDAGTGDGAVRTRWNRAVRDELLLPLLPSALADVVNEVPESAARDVLEAFVGSRTVRTHFRAITQEDVLLPVLTSDGVVWKAHDPGAVRILSVPMWRNASSVVREVFTASMKSDDIVFIDADAPRIGGNIGDWPLDEFERMLSSLSVQELRTYEGLIWAETLVRHVLGSPANTNDRRAAAAARWIVDRIREGVLTTVPERAPQDAENDSRSAWRRLFETLPTSWLIDAPVASQQAVAELATKQAVGPGLVPIPLGRRPDRGVRPTREHVDTALLELGTLLSDPSRVSQRTHLSRLLLAETLLSVRGDLDFDESLRHMPLLRAQRLPDEEDEAWSIATLRLRTERRRVFARTVADDGEGGPVDNPIDPKRAVTDLAEATGESAWLVDATVAAAANVPTPTAEALSFAILQSKEIQSRPIDRAGLIERLAGDAVTTGNADIRNAIRALLTGRSANPGDQVLPLFYVRSQDSQGTAHRRTLEILLRLLGRSWCAIDARLIEPLPYGLVSNLGVKVIDGGVLQRLLDECLGEGIDWHALERDDILHLITHLHGNAAEVRRAWRAMPLHRDHQGGRGPIDDRTWRLGGQLRPPRELEAELRVLDPDPELVDLYVAVPLLDDDGILRAMLESRRPQQFADRIVRALQSNDGSIMLPRDQRLLNLLRETGWLPSRHNDDGIIPNRLIVLPTELAASVAPLAAAGGLGDHRLTADVSSSFWHAAVDAVHEVVGRPDTARQIKRLASALDCATVAAVDGSAHIVLPATSSVDANLVDDALQSPLGNSHLGWALLRTAERALSVSGRPLDDAPSTAREAILSLARSLRGPLPASRQIEILTAISATSPANESRTGRLFRVLLQSFSLSDSFFDDVLPHIALPTQDGVWRDTRQIARSESGVARRHRVLSELRPWLRLDASGAVRQDRARSGTATDVVDTAKALEKFFEPWVQRVPHAAIGAFLSLLGKGKNGAISNLAQHWLGDDVSVDGMLEGLLGTAEYPSSVRVFCSGRVARGPRIEVLNLLGEWVEVDAVEDAETIFAADPELLDHWRGDFWNPQLGDLELGSARRADSITPLKFWNLQLRNIDPGNRTAHDLIALLGGAVEWWAARVLRVDVQVARSWWSRWGTGSQAQVAPVQASILAHLPLTLRQLDVSECIPLRDALRDAERAQRRREQAPSSKIREAIAAERSALDTLAALIREVPEHQLFLWQRVQELIHRFGYREDSVLLELAQNADDALAQAAEIAGDGLPANVRRFVVRVHEHGGVSIVDVIYHGRPINDTGGAAFAAGRDRQWDQDLYFMMLLNLSGKPGEIPGHATPSSTTGRFGLGFKSVHLVSTTPSVVSGFLAFSIAGGLLPVEQPIPNDPEFSPVEGHRGTRIRLPLRLDLAASDLLAGLFRRFAYTRAVLPAFARQIREVVVDGGPYAGVGVFDGEPVENAPGWSVSKVTTELAGHGRWRIMRFRRADAEIRSGTTALVVGLRDGIATTFPSDLPFVWNVAPTSEGWGCGYAINGPFKLDPGRTHVSLDDEATLRVVDLLGEALGKGLVDLYDALVGTSETSAASVLHGGDAQRFVASLWRVLSSGLDTPDDLRHRILLRLHGTDRGVSAWMSARSVVPTGLPAPFAERLPALKAGMRMEVAAGGLGDPDLCRALAMIADATLVIQGHQIVSSEVERRLRPLLRTSIVQIQPNDIFAEVAERWDHVLTPERLHALRPLAGTVWAAIENNAQNAPWHSNLIARAADGTIRPLRELLLPKTVDQKNADATVEEEVLRAALAPDSRTLDPAYICQAEDLTIFLRLRSRHQIDSVTIAGWYADLTSNRYVAAVRYLMRGRLQQEVLQRLVPLETRPPWLQEYEEIRRLLADSGEEAWRCQALLAALFPDRFRVEGEPEPEPTVPAAVKRTFFKRLEEWWSDPEVRRGVIASYEAKAWPDWLRQDGISGGLRAGTRDHWLGLLVLGACQSLGRANESHHRSFLELAHTEGWWDVFKNPDDTTPWMSVLRTWQDRAVGNLVYARWMSLFPSIYQLSRYLEPYKRLLITAGRRPVDLYRVTCLLAPRVDEALTGAGQQFDAPPAPLNMGVHWVLRELMRLGLLDGEHLFPDCWVPSEQVARFLRPLGLSLPSEGAPNSEKARMIFDFLATELQTATPNLHRSFDIPLRYLDENGLVRQELGLEN